MICGIDGDGAAWCWGAGARGQLGDGTTLARNSDVPLKVVGTMKFASINVGRGHVCGIATTKALVCWGSNDSGQTGTGRGTSAVGVPTVAGNTAFKSVSAGSEASCALTLAGYAYCWGWALSGALGVGNTGLLPVVALPVRVLGDLTFAMISNSGAVTCGVTTTNVAYCWGNGGMELGVGTADRYGFDAPRKIALQP